MRSIISTGMFSIEVVPTVAEPTRIPSTRTRVCAEPAPRRKSDCGWPGPPVARTSTPARRCSTSASDSGPAASRSARVMTTASLRVAAGLSPRRAVTTTGSKVAWETVKGEIWACAPRLARPASPARHDAFIVESPCRAASVPAGRRFSTGGQERPSPGARGPVSGLASISTTRLPAAVGGLSGVGRLPVSLTVAGAAPESNRLPVHPFARPSYASARPALETTFTSAAYTLTCHGFSNRVTRMDADFDALEERLAQLVQRLTALRDENRELRQQLAARTDENARLGEKLTAAKSRIEALLRQIPEPETWAPTIARPPTGRSPP